MKEKARTPRLNEVYKKGNLCPFLVIGERGQTPQILCRAAGLSLRINGNGFVNTIPGCEKIRQRYALEGCLKGKLPYKKV